MEAPGCFGHITTHSPKLSVCRACDHNAACAETVQNRVETLKKLNQYPDIPETVPGLRKAARERLPQVEMATTSEVVPKKVMTKKAREIANSLARRGIDLPMAVMGGYNPIETPRFVKDAFGLLLAAGYNKRQLKETFKVNYGWSEATAASHVGMVTSLFTGLGIADVEGQDVKAKTP
jgi:hypothetical protein